MKESLRGLPLPLILAALLQGCGDSTGPQTTACGGGEGFEVAFCGQMENYEAGYGVPGQDVITVTCLVGPEGATVSNLRNGAYSCGGSYTLTSFPSAEISLNWGGTTNYGSYQSATISQGHGTFNIRVEKTSGGSGNLFLSMASGSMWMFDVVLVNTQCSAGAPAWAPRRLAPGSVSTVARDGSMEKTVPWSYDVGG